MNSKDDPFEQGGRTVIRPNPHDQRRRASAGPAPVAPPPAGESPDSTVFDPGAAQNPPPGWGTPGTVLYQGMPFAEHTQGQGGSSDPSGRGRADHGLRKPADCTGKIPQDLLFDAGERVAYCATNPIIAAAAPLLMFFGNLRLMPVELQPAALAEHVADSIEEFERKIASAGVPEEDTRIAKFALCETADDIVRNLPGAEPDAWMKHGMLSRFFQAGAAGVGFFEALNRILAAPETHQDLLEFMHACLSLGFEGQYRGTGRLDGSLERVRRDVYDSIRYFRPRADDEISPRWQGISATTARSSARIPLWAIAASVCALLTGGFFVLRSLITNEGDALAGELLALNPSAPITIERANVVPQAAAAPVEDVKPVAQTAQIDRIRKALAKDIETGGLTVSTKGDFIVVEINNLLLFASGKADVKSEFEPLAGRIAAALQPEPGRIKIVGHTDDVKPRKSSTFKSNYDLSVARAEAVKKTMAPKFGDPSRISVEGKGEDEPIADNKTPEGRAKNRRVDVMIPRQETL